MKPKQENFKNPMFDLTILLESLGLNLNRLQVTIKWNNFSVSNSNNLF